MTPFALSTRRLLLDQPARRDVDAIAAFCSDPLFERFMVTPWPYRRAHAEHFVDEFVPRGWAGDEEWTWSIREGEGLPLLGVVGLRLASGMVGYWLGSPHRGRGVMAEALAAVVDAAFARTDRRTLLWECVVGNRASMRVAQRTGFRFTGMTDGLIATRDGSSIQAWTGELSAGEARNQKQGWPLDGSRPMLAPRAATD